MLMLLNKILHLLLLRKGLKKMVNHKVEYNQRFQRMENSLKKYAIEQWENKVEARSDPLEDILEGEEKWYIKSRINIEELLHHYCLPTPKR